MKRLMWIILAAYVLCTHCVYAAEVDQRLDGKLIITGGTIYRVVQVRSIERSIILHADVEPLYSVRPDMQSGEHWQYKIAPNAKCGVADAGAGTSVDTPDFFIFDNGELVTPDYYLNRVGQPNASHISRLSPDLLERLQTCAKHVAEAADAMPFSRISIYTHNDNIPEFEISPTTSKTWEYEQFPGSDVIPELTAVEIDPQSTSIKDFTVAVQAVSVISCDWGDGHSELDGWKRGYSTPIPLKRVGNRFLIEPALLPKDPPPIPAYKLTELRHAVGEYWHDPRMGAATNSDQCAPFLRGYMFTVRYSSNIAQTLFIKYPGGD